MSIFHASKPWRLFKGERIVMAGLFLMWGIGAATEGDWRELVALGTAVGWWLYGCILEWRLSQVEA